MATIFYGSFIYMIVEPSPRMSNGYAVPIGIAPAVLLVDDNEIQIATRKAILEHAGIEVLIASDGAEALHLLSSSCPPGNVGMVITDHLMPGMSGPEMVREIRQRGFDFPIAVLSGFPDAGDAYEDMGVTFRTKPFHPDSLIALARELLGRPMRRSA